MSVDLGSQFLKIGLVKPGVPMEIVLNKESHRKTPNIVAIRHGERFFSDSAAQLVGYDFFDDHIHKKTYPLGLNLLYNWLPQPHNFLKKLFLGY